MNPPPDSVVQRQLEILCNTLTQMEADMIDPVEYGQLKGSVDSLKREMGDLKKRQERMDEKLDQVLSKLSEARGGWRLLLALGGAAATLGGGITWLFTHTITVGPKG